MVHCGSKGLTPTQQRYSTIELECLAIVWATLKCSFYLRGLHLFTTRKSCYVFLPSVLGSRKDEQYHLGSDIGVTNIPGQQATISGCVDRELEQHLYNLISDNTPVFTPEPNEDEVTSCMDIIADWIAERHPLDARRMELFKLPQEQGEGMVAYSNRILDIADKCDLNDITQQEIMAMVFITHCRSPQFRQ